MTKATAIFSNGFTDTYKGTRPVKAAWAVISTLDGEVLNSGHSLDRDKALKTAEGSLQCCGTRLIARDHPLRYIEGPNPHLSSARRRADRAHNAARLALIRSLTTIEVVDL